MNKNKRIEWLINEKKDIEQVIYLLKQRIEANEIVLNDINRELKDLTGENDDKRRNK